MSCMGRDGISLNSERSFHSLPSEWLLCSAKLPEYAMRRDGRANIGPDRAERMPCRALYLPGLACSATLIANLAASVVQDRLDLYAYGRPLWL